MGKDTKYRINLFTQVKQFWEIAAESNDITVKETGLYFYLLNLNNKLAWKEWFSLSILEALTATKLSEKLYYKTLNRLESLVFIEHRRGVKNKAGQIRIIELKAVNLTTLNDSKAVKTATLNDSKAVKTSENGLLYIDSKDKKNKTIYKENFSFDFYQQQLTDVKAEFEKHGPITLEPNYANYEKLIAFLKGDNPRQTELKNILSVKEQLSFSQYKTIRQRINGTGHKLDEILMKIENDPKYTKGKESLFVIISSWINNDSIKTGNAPEPCYLPFDANKITREFDEKYDFSKPRSKIIITR
ncbi:MAG: hypothetical protein WCR01_11050 [Bacteroidota bacterium]